MITTYGIYILKQKDQNLEDKDQKNVKNVINDKIKFIKEAFINHDQVDYIEVSLGDQSIHFVCINKRQNCWITTASRNLTKYGSSKLPNYL